MTDLAVIMSIYYNDKLDYIKQSVESILNQTFTQFDFYIIFDGPVSMDFEDYINSLEDIRIKKYRLEKNSGLAAALNYLLFIILKNSDYKFIARMDADDISMPERFEKQRKFLLKNTSVTITGSWYREIDAFGNALSDRMLPTEHETLKRRYYFKTPFPHSTVMFRTELVKWAGFYPTDTILMEDNALWGKAFFAGLRFGNVPEYLLKYRIDDDFYSRRSGIKYGWRYIVSRLRINKLLNFPFYAYIFTVLIGFIKMTPAKMIRYFYNQRRNH
jgi:glycosyltransferase involved in cell wall biosynthesis